MAQIRQQPDELENKDGLIEAGVMLIHPKMPKSIFTKCCRKPLSVPWPLMMWYPETRREEVIGHVYQCSGCFKLSPCDERGCTATLKKGWQVEDLRDAWQIVKKRGLSRNPNGLPGLAYWFVKSDGFPIHAAKWDTFDEAPAIDQEIKQALRLSPKAPMHGLDRKNLLAGNAYQPDDD